MISRFSDFVGDFIFGEWGLHLRFRTSSEVEIQYVNSSDRITQSFNIATLE